MSELEQAGGSARESLERAFSQVDGAAGGDDERRPDSASDAVADEEHGSLTKPWHREALKDAADRRSILEKHLAGRTPDDVREASDAWERSREAREALKARYPGQSLKQIVESYVAIDSQLRNPATRHQAAETLLRGYLQAPQLAPLEGKKADAAQSKDARGALDRAMTELADRDALAAFENAPEFVQGQLGSKIDFILNQVAENDRAMWRDPYGGVATLLARYGEAATPAQIAEVNAQGEQLHALNEMSGFVANVAQSGHFPQFAELAGEIAAELESREFPWHQVSDPGAALAIAYSRANEKARIEGAKALRDKAGKSISGSPSGAATRGTSGTPSARDALSRAMGGI